MRLHTCILILVVGAGALVGCARFHVLQDETLPDGTARRTELRGSAFLDSKGAISKLRTTFTDKSQGISIGSVNGEASGSNALAILGVVTSAAVEGAVKGASGALPLR